MYQLVSYNDTYTNYEFESNFKTFLETKAGKTGDQQNDIATYFAKQSAPDTTKLIEEFVTLCNTAGSGYAGPAEYSRTLAAGTSADVQVEPGYYMIIMETSVNASRIYQPITVFVRVDADKLHIYIGGSAAPITGNNWPSGSQQRHPDLRQRLHQEGTCHGACFHHGVQLCDESAEAI